MMIIIKENQKGTKRLCIRTNSYANSLKHFNMLYDEAKKDFPSLETKDIEIMHYGGMRIKYTYGIEFAAIGDIPDSYKQTQFEKTL